MRRLLILPFVALAACAKPAPAPSAPLATATLLTTIGDSTTMIESVAMFGGKLYTTDWNGRIWEVDPAAPTPKQVASLPHGGSYLGEVADSAGDLLIANADSGIVWRVAKERLGAADFDPKKDAQRFITGAGHANGITIAADGHVWITGGDVDTLYHAGPNGGKAVAFAGGYSPILADTTMPVRGYVVNGVTFDSHGNAYTVNTGTGTVYKLEVKPDHTPGTITKLAESPTLVGADGITAGPGDTLYVDANYRNAFVRVSPTGEVTELVSDSANTGVLHFPAELVRDGKTFYIANLNFGAGAAATAHRPGASIAKVVLP
ncbi:MAG TPA: hypothetical protein VFI13_07195 [Gemmatimonadales bacterium]|nr:hypothetical protein [Gemmatimonadales bacterium]